MKTKEYAFKDLDQALVELWMALVVEAEAPADIDRLLKEINASMHAGEIKVSVEKATELSRLAAMLTQAPHSFSQGMLAQSMMAFAIRLVMTLEAFGLPTYRPN